MKNDLAPIMADEMLTIAEKKGLDLLEEEPFKEVFRCVAHKHDIYWSQEKDQYNMFFKLVGRRVKRRLARRVTLKHWIRANFEKLREESFARDRQANLDVCPID